MKIITILLLVFVVAFSTTNLKAQARERSAKYVAFNKAYHETDSAKAVQFSQDFLNEYPINQADPAKDKAENIQYSRIYVILITKTKQPIDAKIKEYADRITFLTAAELYYRQVYLMNSNKIMPAEKLVDRSNMLMKIFRALRDNKPREYSSNTDEEWKKIFGQTYWRNLLAHVNILQKAHVNKPGLAESEEAFKYFGYTKASLNEDRALLLNALGLKQELNKALEESVRANQATPAMLELLRKAYTAKNGKQFDEYISSLKDGNDMAKLEKELSTSMIKKTMAEFTLLDASGKKVSTKDWKGKTVVLDFFASWCVPCKAAFPGMKLALNSFANDKDVIFYFIDTQEHTKNYKETVIKYLKDNDFPFHVLFDETGDADQTNRVAKMLGVSGIPRKFVLDRNGDIRFDMTGYYGSPTKLADEIKIMVNLAKKAE
ncbi:TlpA family protein disulfide reductase [Pedobacter frigidisoli]|uniref:TlpA family protein disulfide reductase n=1 Tax=Pedobacter frigidisoli TaxID=2530455 RepID=A0A4R0NJ58_9SPHI|nr:TlpA disulfide reductase family protein [Pedobacter frigidisoli]TCD00730.1 TlpA family protein disulfide reductase [Pedobacter frigidisoli]